MKAATEKPKRRLSTASCVKDVRRGMVARHAAPLRRAAVTTVSGSTTGRSASQPAATLPAVLEIPVMLRSSAASCLVTTWPARLGRKWKGIRMPR